MALATRLLPPSGRIFQRGADLPDNRVSGIEGGVQPKLLTVKPPLVVGRHMLFLSAFKEAGLLDPLHKHDDHESIGFQLKGRQRIVIGDEEFVSEPGDAWYHGPGVVHMSEALEDTIQLEMKSPPMRTWGDVEPSGPLDPAAWVRPEDPSGRWMRPYPSLFTRQADVPVERIAKVEDVAESGLTVTPLMVGRDMLLMAAFKPQGMVDPLHRHDDHESIGYCISGRLLLRIGGEEHVAGPGDAWYHGYGVEHWSEALEDVVQLEVKNPPMKTWISH